MHQRSRGEYLVYLATHQESKNNDVTLEVTNKDYVQNHEPTENTTASFNDLQNTEILAANKWYEFELQQDTISLKTQSNTDGSIVILTVNNQKEPDAINETLTELEDAAVAETLTKDNSLTASDTEITSVNNMVIYNTDDEIEQASVVDDSDEYILETEEFNTSDSEYEDDAVNQNEL